MITIVFVCVLLNLALIIKIISFDVVLLNMIIEMIITFLIWL
jgi:hypothetical protein